MHNSDFLKKIKLKSLWYYSGILVFSNSQKKKKKSEEWTITATIHATTFKDVEERRNIISVSAPNFGIPKARIISVLL